MHALKSFKEKIQLGAFKAEIQSQYSQAQQPPHSGSLSAPPERFCQLCENPQSLTQPWPSCLRRLDCPSYV